MNAIACSCDTNSLINLDVLGNDWQHTPMLNSQSYSTSALFKLCQMFVLLTVCLGLPLSALGSDQKTNIEATHAKARATYESVKLPKNEDMGFLGATILFDVNDWLSTGVGAYGALVGQRGGFITLGGAVEARREISPWLELNSGVFVGAGGGRGGYQLAGGGLMLRYHLGAELKSERWGNLGAGFSYIDFPDGTIHSSQPYISYEYPFKTLMSSGWFESSESYSDDSAFLPKSEHEFSVVSRTYRIPNGVMQDNGNRPQHPTINLVGVEWNRYLSDHYFIRVESEGAMGGKSNGYMQILFGGGYRVSLLDNTYMKLTTSAGVAGGGAVATGGGFLVDATVALQQRLGDRLFAEIAAGYVLAPGADFKAMSYAGKLGYYFHTPDFSGERVSVSSLRDFEPLNLRVRLAHQSYFKASPQWRTHHADLNVDLLGVQADYFMNENFFLTGQGIAAYEGKAGAYMTGLVGAGVHLPIMGSPLYTEAELLIGAAGGGGMAVGGGLVWQGSAGLGYQLNKAYSIQASYGHMSALKGAFKANTLTLSIGYRFSFFLQ